MTDREIMQQALEALTVYDGTNGESKRKRVLAALRERLAQPEPAQQRIDYRAECWPESPHYKPAQQQEPVAWMVYALDGTSVCVTDNPADFTPEHRALPLYTSPPASKPWVWLTDEEIDDIYQGAGKNDLKRARAIEAKLKEKNA